MKNLTLTEENELRKLAIQSLRLYNKVEKFQAKLAKKGIFLPNGISVNYNLLSATRKLTIDSSQI